MREHHHADKRLDNLDRARRHEFYLGLELGMKRFTGTAYALRAKNFLARKPGNACPDAEDVDR